MMRNFGALRWVAAAAIALTFAAATPSTSQAATGLVALDIVRGGLHHRRVRRQRCAEVWPAGRYPLSVGGVSIGATIGASGVQLVGRAYNMRRPSDIIGTYTARPGLASP